MFVLNWYILLEIFITIGIIFSYIKFKRYRNQILVGFMVWLTVLGSINYTPINSNKVAFEEQSVNDNRFESKMKVNTKKAEKFEYKKSFNELKNDIEKESEKIKNEI
jgi:hypothetical protein